MSKQSMLFDLHPAMQALWKALLKEQQTLVITGALLAMGSLAWLWLGWLDWAWRLLGSSILLALAGNCLYEIRKEWKKGQPVIWQTLQEMPQQVVWVYSGANTISFLGLYEVTRTNLCIALDTGKLYTIRVPNHQVRVIIRTLHRIVPHASFGFSSDRQESFRRNPVSLRRNS